MILLILLLAQDAHPWGGWKEGTTITLRTTATCGKVKSVKEEKFLVLRTDGKTAVVQVETTEGGVSSKRDDTWVLSDAGPKPAGDDKGKQEIAVDGKKFSCTVLEERERGFGGESVTTRWVCSDAPTPWGLVKMEAKGSVGNNVLTGSFKLLKLKEAVKAKGQTYSCWVTESYSGDEVSKVTAKTWYSRDVPGWFVKQEKKIDAGGEPTVMMVEIVAVDVKK